MRAYFVMFSHLLPPQRGTDPSPVPIRSGHPLPREAVSELAKSRFLERIINNLRCAKVKNT